MKTWMRKRGDRVKIISGKYAGHRDTVKGNMWTVGYPDEFHDGHHVMLDTEKLVTVRHDQVVEFLARRAYLLDAGVVPHRLQ